jgi:hypothetical protein
VKEAQEARRELRRHSLRRARFLLGDGAPRWVRIYDLGPDGGADRYTVVFTGRYRVDGYCYVLGMSSNPFHPQGVGMINEYPGRIDRPTSSHLGRRIGFSELPEPCRRLVEEHYYDLWDLGPTTVVSRRVRAL